MFIFPFVIALPLKNKVAVATLLLAASTYKKRSYCAWWQ